MVLRVAKRATPYFIRDEKIKEVGNDHLTIKRLLNHKSNDITAQYIQWHSRENLLVMKKALESVR